MENGINLIEHAVLRAAAWPIETAAAFGASGLAEAAHRLIDAEQALVERRARVSATLHAAVSATPERHVRAYLLAVRRLVHATTLPLPEPPGTVQTALSSRPALARLLAEEGSARLALTQQHADFDRLYSAELDRQSAELCALTAEPRFRKALAIANPAVAVRWADAPAKPGRPTARARRLEATLFHYLMRAAGRATPQGAWAGVAPVAPTGREGEEPAHLTVEPATARYDVGVSLQPFAAILGMLARQPRYRQGATLRLNPTLFATDEGWRYERELDGAPTWVLLPRQRLTATIIGYYEDGNARPAAPLLDAIVQAADGGGELRTQLERVVVALVEREVLQSDLELRNAAPSVWDTLEEVAPRLAEADRAYWCDAVGRVRTSCEELGRAFEATDVDGVTCKRSAIEAEVQRLWEWSGMPGQVPGPLVTVDLRLPFQVSWNPALITHATEAVHNLLSFYAADGGAELYRRRSIQEIVETCEGQNDVPLLPLLASGRLHWQGNLTLLSEDGDSDVPLDSRQGLFARFAPDPALEREVLAQCSAWEEALDAAHAEPLYTLPTPMAPPGVLPGAGGTLLLHLAGKAKVWAGPGRPQPGLFVGRFANVLAESDGAPAPIVTALQEWSAGAARAGVSPVELVGRCPLNPNAALRPNLTAARLAPHGREELSLQGLSLRIQHGGRPFLRQAGHSDLLVPVYNSGAGMGPSDPGSWLLFVLAMAHGWEFVSFGFPALPAERGRWGHLPRLQLCAGAVLSRERWTIGREIVARLAACSSADRYLAWRAEAERLHLPALVHVRCGPHAHDLLFRTDSPLAVRCLFDTLAAEAPYLVITELPGDPDAWPVVDADGQHYLAELAVIWHDDGYWTAAVPAAKADGAARV